MADFPAIISPIMSKITLAQTGNTYATSFGRKGVKDSPLAYMPPNEAVINMRHTAAIPNKA